MKSWKDNILMADSIDTEDKNAKVLGGNTKRSNVISVTFLDTIKDLPNNSWDVSIDKSGSVMAYVEKAKTMKITDYMTYILQEREE